MIELAPDFVFAAKALEEDNVAFHFGMRYFDRDRLAIANIGRAEDGGHAAARNHAFDAVVVELIARVKSNHSSQRPPFIPPNRCWREGLHACDVGDFTL